MLKNNKRNLITASVALITTVLLIAVAVYAWFSPSGANNSFSVNSGELDLSTAVYMGNDKDKDGVLESESVVEPTRAAKLKGYYTQVNKSSLTVHGNFIAGNSLTLKLAIINPANSLSDALVDFSFSALDNYVFSALKNFADSGKLVPDGVSVNTLFDEVSARTLFKLENFAVNIYSGKQDDSFENGFEKLVGSTSEAEGASKITPPTDKMLWSVSSGEKVVDALLLKKGCLMEIDFKLTLMQLTEALASEYSAYSLSYVQRCVDHTVSEATAAEYIRNFINAEIAYQTSEDDLEDKNNGFTVNRIFVYGKQATV